MMEEIINELSKYGSITGIEKNRIRCIFYDNPEDVFLKLDKTLKGSGIYYRVKEIEDQFELEFMHIEKPKHNYLLHLVLFLLTVLSTLFVGTIQRGFNPLRDPTKLIYGIPFSLTLLLILGIHEMGHFLASKKNGIFATLPYFIPFPHPLIGTMGAFIKIKAPITNRRTLMEIGIAGPISGFIVAIPLTLIGLKLSQVVEAVPGPERLALGNSIIFSTLLRIAKGPLPEGYTVLLHPMAFAGWLGLFVTALNLLPVGQLDGGHIMYSLLSSKFKYVSRIFWLMLVPLGLLWPGWWFWGLLLAVMGLRHPEPLNNYIKLSLKHKILGAVAALILMLTFVPSPFSVK